MTIEIGANIAVSHSVLAEESLADKVSPVNGFQAQESPTQEKTSALQDLHEKILSSPDVDNQKIEDIKNKIANRELDILNASSTGQEAAQRIADKILKFERDLFSK